MYRQFSHTQKRSIMSSVFTLNKNLPINDVMLLEQLTFIILKILHAYCMMIECDAFPILHLSINKILTCDIQTKNILSYILKKTCVFNILYDIVQCLIKILLWYFSVRSLIIVFNIPIYTCTRLMSKWKCFKCVKNEIELNYPPTLENFPPNLRYKYYMYSIKFPLMYFKFESMQPPHTVDGNLEFVCCIFLKNF